MTHFMNLNPLPFAKIKSGRKDIELRLNDEKRKLISVGDEIVFTNTQDKSTLCTQVVALHRFKNFAELYKVLPLERCGYSKNELKTAQAEDMYEYYSKEQEKLYGALGIELKLCNKSAQG